MSGAWESGAVLVGAVLTATAIEVAAWCRRWRP